MLLVVDSGSTKSDWVLVQDQENLNFNTMGLNPYFHDEDTVYNAIHSNIELFHFSEIVSELYFYGAGCSAPHLNSIIERGLQRAFPNAIIHVGHDLTACAYATYTGIPAISCIIGTGSNSCYFDGNEVSEVIPALGYILGVFIAVLKVDTVVVVAPLSVTVWRVSASAVRYPAEA